MQRIGVPHHYTYRTGSILWASLGPNANCQTPFSPGKTVNGSSDRKIAQRICGKGDSYATSN